MCNLDLLHIICHNFTDIKASRGIPDRLNLNEALGPDQDRTINIFQFLKNN